MAIPFYTVLELCLLLSAITVNTLVHAVHVAFMYLCISSLDGKIFYMHQILTSIRIWSSAFFQPEVVGTVFMAL